ncbi:MAG: hypothetical protein ACRDQF_14410 [Thermocrispum sp.]
MNGGYEDNDGRFPDEAEVEVRYPAPGQDGQDRDTWPWLPGVVLGQCGPDEWHVVIELRELATLEDGSAAPAGTPDHALYYPWAWRDASELRRPGQGEGAAR